MLLKKTFYYLKFFFLFSLIAACSDSKTNSQTIDADTTSNDVRTALPSEKSQSSSKDNIYSDPDKNIISWARPYERENGAELSPSELKEYIIYYGTRSKTYTGFIEISKKINGVLPTSASVAHLEADVVYYFSGLTIDSNGFRSKMSNEISKLIKS